MGVFSKEVEESLEEMTNAIKDSELKLVNLMTDSNVQKAILKNLIEVKYLLMQIVKKC